jgi:hypothetical protein
MHNPAKARITFDVRTLARYALIKNIFNFIVSLIGLVFLGHTYRFNVIRNKLPTPR